MIANLSFTWPDYVIVGVIGLSVLISLVRGFIREAVSLATWIAAIWLAFKFSPALSQLFGGIVKNPSLQVIIAFIVILVLVVVTGAIINYLLSLLVETSGLSGTDRLLGIIFGGLRGVLIVGALVLIGNLSAIAQTQPWEKAELVPRFQGLADWLEGFIPEKFTQLESSQRDLR